MFVASLSSSLMLMGKARSTEKGLATGVGYGPVSRQGCKMDKHSSLFSSIRIDYRKKFYSIGSRASCYKSHYVRNLRIFVVSQSVCPWQAFPAKSNVFEVRPRAYPKGELLLRVPLGQAPAFLTNISLGQKSLQVTNTPAYYEHL